LPREHASELDSTPELLLAKALYLPLERLDGLVLKTSDPLNLDNFVLFFGFHG
jgi:hypothetical protein